jgi:Na+-translocating ferredoxin:NAD+ oxidoreductase subunit B
MSDTYKELAKKLDEMPNGFPSTESGVELKILKKIFAPAEAEMALKLNPLPETAEAIAGRLGKPVPEMTAILDGMAAKGQIGSFKMLGKQRYMFVPYLVGISEFQNYRMDEEFAALHEEYTPYFLKTVGGFEPALFRVVPINESLDPQLQVHRYEDARGMIDAAKSFRLNECYCRKQMALIGRGCKHPLEVCLTLSSEEDAFDYFSLGGKSITKEQAHAVLQRANEEGLVHFTYNQQQGHAFLCSCCPCSCGIFRALKEFNAPFFMVKSNFVASIDREKCTPCGICKDQRCPMGAIVEESGVYRVRRDRCIGCGVCAVACPDAAIQLVGRPETERNVPPGNAVEWNVARAKNRVGKSRAD